jgi:uncharacterized membrane protein
LGDLQWQRFWGKEMIMDNAKLNKRALVVFFMLFSVAILPFSGFLLHEASAHDLERPRFIAMALHNVAAIVFTIATIVHIKYNWKPIIHYIRDKKDRLIKYPQEMAIAGSTLAILLLIAIVHVTQSHW